MLADEICQHVIKKVNEKGKCFRFIDAGVGLRYTYVIAKDEVSQKYIGLSYTPIEDIAHVSLELRSIKELSLENLCEFVASPNYISRAVAFAALNALSVPLFCIKQRWINKDLADVIRVNPLETVVFVGYITPLIGKIRKKANKIYILERNPFRRRDALPDTLAPRILREADKVIVSGAALINDTIDQVLNYVKKDAVIGIVGATASILPEPLFAAGVNLIGGFRVRKDRINSVSELVKLGAGTPEIYKQGFKYVITL